MSIDVRERMTERVNRARLELEIKRGRGPFLVTLVGVAIGLACATWTISNLSRSTLSRTTTVKFAVDDASAVVPGRNQIRFKGLAAGDIVKSEFIDGQAVLTVKLQKKFGRIYRDARAELRPDTPLEDMHLDIVDRGTPSAGVANGGTAIAKAQTSSQVQIENVLDMFQPDVRDHFREMLANLGNGLQDRGDDLRQAFAVSVPLLAAAGKLGDQLAVRKTRVARLVHNSRELTEELGRREELLRGLVRDGAMTAAALQANRANHPATLAELPPTLREADSALAALGGVLGDVDTAVVKLKPVAARLPEGLSSIRTLSASLGPAAKQLKEPVRHLVPLSASLVPLSRRLNSSFQTLTPQLPVLDRATSDLVKCEDGVSLFFLWQPTAGVFDDKRGTMLRADVQASALANGTVATPRRSALQSCNGGEVVGGRQAEAKDKR
jgi:ABC-type transporter Mla subunit MlaD